MFMVQRYTFPHIIKAQNHIFPHINRVLGHIFPHFAHSMAEESTLPGEHFGVGCTTPPHIFFEKTLIFHYTKPHLFPSRL